MSNQNSFLYSYNRNRQIVQNNDIVKFDIVYGNEIIANNNINYFTITQKGLYKINYCVYVSSIFPVFLGLYKNNKLIPGSKYGNMTDNFFLINIKKLIDNLSTLVNVNDKFSEIKLISSNPNEKINEYIDLFNVLLNNQFSIDVNNLKDNMKILKNFIDDLDTADNINIDNALYNVYNTIIELIKNNIDDIYHKILYPPIIEIRGTTFVECDIGDIIDLKNLSNYTIIIPIINSFDNPNGINANIDIEKKFDICNISKNYYINNQNINQHNNS